MRRALTLIVFLMLAFVFVGCSFRVEVKVDILPNPILPVGSFGVALEWTEDKDEEPADTDVPVDSVDVDGVRPSDGD